MSFGECQLDIEGVSTDDKVVIDNNNMKLQIIVIWMKFFSQAKESALVILKSKGGDGVVHEVREYLIENRCLK